MKKICLSMIVRNEAAIIARCLESVKPLIDYWVIVDTGSSDATQEIIEETMHGIPGELFQRPWIDFATNRNQALELSQGKSDYILCIDADDTIEIDSSFRKSSLRHDGYWIFCRDPVVDSYRMLLIKNQAIWQWRGVLHEELTPLVKVSTEFTNGIVKNGLLRDGHLANDPERYSRDAEILEAEHRANPENTRTLFYLAQSYVSAGNLIDAMKFYEKRADMGGYIDEVFWSLYYSACIKDDLKYPSQEIIDSYWRAYFCLNRAEPLCYLSRYLIKIGQYGYAYLCAKEASIIEKPKTLHFVRRSVYEYESLLYLALSQHLLKLYDEAKITYNQLLKKKDLPDNERKTIGAYLSFCEKKEGLTVVS